MLRIESKCNIAYLKPVNQVKNLSKKHRDISFLTCKARGRMFLKFTENYLQEIPP